MTVISPISSAITPTLLSTLQNHPSLPRHSWYLVAASALTVLNRPDEVARIYASAIENVVASSVDIKPGTGEQLDISRRIREALIKTSAIGGIPKVNTKKGVLNYASG